MSRLDRRARSPPRAVGVASAAGGAGTEERWCPSADQSDQTSAPT